MLMSNIKRPALRYFGGKFRIAEQIISYFPKHKTYVEVFGGGASILLRKEPSFIEVYNDVYGEVVNFFKCLRDYPEKMAHALQYTPWSREEYEKSLIVNDLDTEIERARKFFVRSWQSISMGGLKNKPSHFRSTTTGGFRTLERIEIYAVADRLRRVCIENLDWEACIDKYDKNNILFYIDPPYVNHKEYLHTIDHERLVTRLLNVKNKCIVSSNRNDLYDSVLSSWVRVDLDHRGLQAKSTSECLYMNFGSKQLELQW